MTNTIYAAQRKDRMLETPELIPGYLARIDMGKLLTHQEEIDLTRRTKKSDEAARKRLIEKNLRLVVSIAKKSACQRRRKWGRGACGGPAVRAETAEREVLGWAEGLLLDPDRIARRMDEAIETERAGATRRLPPVPWRTGPQSSTAS